MSPRPLRMNAGVPVIESSGTARRPAGSDSCGFLRLDASHGFEGRDEHERDPDEEQAERNPVRHEPVPRERATGEEGAPLAEIANQLGHTDVNTTAGYLGRRQVPTRAATVMTLVTEKPSLSAV